MIHHVQLTMFNSSSPACFTGIATATGPEDQADTAGHRKAKDLGGKDSGIWIQGGSIPCRMQDDDGDERDAGRDAVGAMPWHRRADTRIFGAISRQHGTEVKQTVRGGPNEEHRRERVEHEAGDDMYA